MSHDNAHTFVGCWIFVDHAKIYSGGLLGHFSRKLMGDMGLDVDVAEVCDVTGQNALNNHTTLLLRFPRSFRLG